MSVWWTDELDAQLRAMWPDRNNTLGAMGAALGKSLSAVSRRAQKLGLVPRHVKRDGGGHDRYLRDEAARRGVTVPMLKCHILSIVARDRLVAAVLDDEVSEMEKAA